ncbi:hypothetical protein ACTFIY_008339 [Dictyostelium cf. discoideum]
MNIIKIIFSLSLFMMMISSSFSQAQYLRIDLFGDDQCKEESVYSTQWVKLNYCNGQYVYRYVPNLGDGSTTATGNPLTTAGTLSSVDITSIVTQAVTLGMSGVGGLTSSGLLSIGALNVDNLVDAAASQSENQNSGTTSQSPLPTSNPISSTTTTTTTNGATTITNNPTTSQSSSSVLTNSGLLTIGGTTVSAVTDFVTSLISSSLTNIITTGNGGATTSVQGNMGNVVQYYCLSASGCLTQCVSLRSFPIGICTKAKLDNVVYSVVNDTDMIVKIDNTTNPGPNNGYCQSFTSPSACVTDNIELTQYMNNQCGKGIKINCTSSVYNSYNCVDSSCLQCSKINSYPLNQCNLINSTSGVMFKSLLKTPITEEPTPLPSSSSSTNDTGSSQQSSNSNNSFYNNNNNNNNNMITIIILSIFFIISMI